MPEGQPSENPTSAEVGAIWERIADFWDDHLGEGNDFQKQLIMPATDRLLEPKPGQTILDIACGNGNYARRLAELGANVVACDLSERFLQRAKAKPGAANAAIEYRRIDATDAEQLLTLEKNRFDSAVCSMALMDMPTVDPLLQTLPKLLKPGGRFVFSVPHPCFNSSGTRMTAELVNESGHMEQTFGIAVRDYLQTRPDLSSGILHQPEPHFCFHRPISMLLQSCFDSGFNVDGGESGAAGAKDHGRANLCHGSSCVDFSSNRRARAQRRSSRIR